MVNEVVVSDVSEYISGINQINVVEPKDEFIRHKELLFRGQSDKNHELIPSLGRYGSGKEDLCFVESATYQQ